MEEFEFITKLIEKISHHELIVMDKVVKKGKCSGYVYLPNKYAGKKITILMDNEDKSGNIQEQRQS